MAVRHHDELCGDAPVGCLDAAWRAREGVAAHVHGPDADGRGVLEDDALERGRELPIADDLELVARAPLLHDDWDDVRLARAGGHEQLDDAAERLAGAVVEVALEFRDGAAVAVARVVAARGCDEDGAQHARAVLVGALACAVAHALDGVARGKGAVRAQRGDDGGTRGRHELAGDGRGYKGDAGRLAQVHHGGHGDGHDAVGAADRAVPLGE